MCTDVARIYMYNFNGCVGNCCLVLVLPSLCTRLYLSVKFSTANKVAMTFGQNCLGAAKKSLTFNVACQRRQTEHLFKLPQIVEDKSCLIPAGSLAVDMATTFDGNRQDEVFFLSLSAA